MAPARAVLDQLTVPRTVDELVGLLGISPNAVRKRLASRRAAGLVAIDGGPGLPTTYARTAPSPG